ncbi:hypothetical protein Ocin01_00686 [Orchesella cincta]|uniref:Uncharacterized protein n=1 Tax=Orchesella cincta TaxID=48709 RepID=A0A1D2NL91_ORCCI|nr:hypothetical protein Ocin01_00686 [Orchesella cincta]
MNRVHPKELLEISPEDLSKLKEPGQEDEDLSTISEFSWKIAVKYLDKRLVDQLGRSDMYFLDGRPINDDSFLESITMEICQEYGLQLLDIIADLILPVGFKYPTLLTSLHELVEDGLKPVSTITLPKTIVWVDDIHWNNPKSSIVEKFMCELLMRNVEPFLVAPKYFDQEALSMLSGKLVTGQLQTGSGDASETKRKSWDAFSILLKFGFILLLRASNCPLIVFHVSQKTAEIIDAYALLDRAEAEGHTVMNLKNTASTTEERNEIVMSFVDKVVNIPAVKTQKSTLPSRLPTTAESTSSSSELSSLSSTRDISEDMDVGHDRMLEEMTTDDNMLSDFEDDDPFENDSFAAV